MAAPAQTKAIPWATCFIALLGLAWCAYIAFPTGTPLPCATSGCALFRDSRFAGVSLWWVGGAYFLLLSIVCLRGKPGFARLMTRVALLLDMILLAIMLVTAPCFDCLVVAVFLALSFFTSRPRFDAWFTGTPSRSLLLPIWFGLFLANSTTALNEVVPMYTLGNSRSDAVRLYFSPSCKHCLEAVATLGNAARLYPIEKEEGDFEAILRFESLLKVNVPIVDALTISLDPDMPVPALPFYERAIISAQLLRNKSVVMSQGFMELPLIQMNGMPQSEDEQSRSRARGATGNFEMRNGYDQQTENSSAAETGLVDSQLPDYLDQENSTPLEGGENGPPAQPDINLAPEQSGSDMQPNQSPRGTGSAAEPGQDNLLPRPPAPARNSGQGQRNARPGAQSSNNGVDLNALLQDAGNLGQCAQGSPVPCD